MKRPILIATILFSSIFILSCTPKAGQDSQTEDSVVVISDNIEAKHSSIEQDGRVTETLSNSMFIVELENGQKVVANLSGKIRMNYIKVLPGDSVKLEISPYDVTKGRIIYKYN